MGRTGRWLLAGMIWAALAATAMPAAASAAATDYTWSGAAASSDWSQGNWGPSAAPVPDETAGAVTFPAPLANCTNSGPTSCYVSDDDVSGLSVGSLSVS